MIARILVISPEVLFPTNAGGRAAVLAQCMVLGEAGYAVDLLVFHRHPVTAAAAQQHREIGEHVIFVRRRPLPVSTIADPMAPYQVSSRWLSRTTVQHAERRLPRPDLIIAQQEWSIPAATRLWRDAPPPVALSSHNDERSYYRDQQRAARGYRRHYLRLERLRIGRSLRRSIRSVAGVVTLSPLDEAVYSGHAVRTIPHPFLSSIDASRVRPPGSSVLFVGALDMPHAVDGLLWFVREVWPEVRRRAPKAQFDVAGRRASAVLRQELATTEGVHFHGEVPDLRSLYAEASVFVNPVFVGSGVNIKLADPVGLGIPSVTTSTGARGYERLGDALLIADDPAAFAQDCVALLTEQEHADRVSAALRSSAESTMLPAVAALWRAAIDSFIRPDSRQQDDTGPSVEPPTGRTDRGDRAD